MKDYILDLDKPRELRFGFKASRMVRQTLGERSLESLLNLKWDEVPILIWAGLKWADNSLTVEQVEGLLDDAIPKKYTILKATEIALEALAEHMGIGSKKAAAGAPTVEVKPEKKKQPTETIPSTKKQKK